MLDRESVPGVRRAVRADSLEDTGVEIVKLRMRDQAPLGAF
jgi:hypothetical protein